MEMTNYTVYVAIVSQNFSYSTAFWISDGGNVRKVVFSLIVGVENCLWQLRKPDKLARYTSKVLFEQQ